MNALEHSVITGTIEKLPYKYLKLLPFPKKCLNYDTLSIVSEVFFK